MTDVRCPMCGKLNPDDLDVCQFCQARLKPLHLSSSSNGEAIRPGDEPTSGDSSGLEESLPEWLKSIRSSGDVDKVKEEAKTEPSDWLNGLRQDIEIEEGETEISSLPPISPQPAETQIPEVPLPEWLAGMEGELEMDVSSEEIAEHAQTELPAWLEQEFSEIPPEGEESQASASLPSIVPEGERKDTEESLPEWLTGLEPNLSEWSASGKTQALVEPFSSDIQTEESQPENIFDESVPHEAELIPQKPEEKKHPLGDLEAGGELQSVSLESESQEVGDFDWLKELEEGETAFHEVSPEMDREATERKEGDIPLTEVPLTVESLDWLSDLAFEEKEPAESYPSQEEEGENIQPGSLPGWLEAMRPVTAMDVPPGLAGEGEIVVEGAGPLAGLVGALPAEPDAYLSRKLGAYSLKLQVSETQQRHADLLSKLIEGEGEPRPIPPRSLVTPQHILRSVVFLLLFLAIVFPIFYTLPSDISPQLSTGIFSINQLINDLPPQAPVLLAMDYQPGIIGEMDAVTLSVIDHLMIKGGYLTIVSTLPTGPVQGERMIELVNATGAHQYLSPTHYVNLGFIPGGQSSLVAFAAAPPDILPSDINGRPAWINPPLQSVDTIANFEIVIVATESSETAKVWIEQVQPQLGDTPLVMLLSAQVEPLINPYYEGFSQQVQGLMAGFVSGVSYESLLGRPLKASADWGQFNLGIIVAVFLIIVGSAVSIILGLLDIKKRAEAETER